MKMRLRVSIVIYAQNNVHPIIAKMKILQSLFYILSQNII